MLRVCGLLFLMLPLLASAAGCNRKAAAADEPKDQIVGTWTGTYTNPTVGNGSTGSSGMPMDFVFGSDGSYRTGKRKVWVNGTYQFTGPKTFEVTIKKLTVKYDIVELTSDRLVFERKLGEGRVQRTELTRS